MTPPSARRSRRYGRRRGTRTLSTRSIFSSRSARSQANQIYALRRRIARIGRQLRPDVKQSTIGPFSKTFTNNATANTWYSTWFGIIGNGTADNARVGDKVSLRSSTIYASFEYANNFTAEPVTVEAKGCTVRVIVLQARTATGYGEDLADPSAIVHGYTNTGAQYDLNTVSPLKEGITKTWAVLRDMRFRLSEDNPVKQLVLRLKPKWRTLRYESTSPEGGGDPVNHPNHGFFVFVCVSGLHWFSSVSEQVSMSIQSKYAWTDL